MFLFRLWCLDNDVKSIGIVGELPELTFSKYTNGNNEKAYNKAMSLARNLFISGIEITRIRIEAVFLNKDEKIDNYAKNNLDGYFEFHIKYHIVNSKDYHELEKIAKNFTKNNTNCYAFIGFNSFKKNIEPIFTLRVKEFTTEQAIHYKNLLMNVLKQSGFRTNEEIHTEYVFYDKEYKHDSFL